MHALLHTQGNTSPRAGWNNYIVTPDLERPAGRPVNTTPIYADLKAAGCHFSFHNGWEVPAWFDHALDSGLVKATNHPRHRLCQHSHLSTQTT